MTRWIMLVLTIIGFALIFSTKSSALLALGLLAAVVGLFGFVFALAADRVSASARPETSMATKEDLLALRRRPPRVPPAPGKPGGGDPAG
jgi:hypothetical protein